MADCQRVQLKVSIVFRAADPDDIGARAYTHLVPLRWTQYVQNGPEFHVVAQSEARWADGFRWTDFSRAYELQREGEP